MSYVFITLFDPDESPPFTVKILGSGGEPRFCPLLPRQITGEPFPRSGFAENRALRAENIRLRGEIRELRTLIHPDDRP